MKTVFWGGGTLDKAIKHYRLSRGTPFECNIKACTINKSIFLVSARLELWESISPLRQKWVIRREQRGGCATSKQAARLSSHLQSSRDRMLCWWGGWAGFGLLPFQWKRANHLSLHCLHPNPYRWKWARLNLSMRIDNKGTRGQNLPTLLGKTTWVPLRACLNKSSGTHSESPIHKITPLTHQNSQAGSTFRHPIFRCERLHWLDSQ